ncbi:PilT protein domain protein [Crenothrix polyspora]|uniref:PilT protein domain protein n=1 Tax=Crenothrix polyspora TaxID=360316 RepID=A0A1R4H125_9GAMM|nr:type II toxin-antitoxin system VapC family toxin [Crenothrix polyspora]SJM89928.1 PilT protein domain protein [Crenothrix polyspora]
MMALDTNVLVRFLVKDDDKQAQLVYQLFKQSEEKQETLFVPLLVVLETIWVLQSVYDIADTDIVLAINDLLLMPVLKFEAQSAIQGFIVSAREVKFDLADLLIAHSAKAFNCQSVFTFDKKAASFKYFQLLGA